jgi:hypothetical protein
MNKLSRKGVKARRFYLAFQHIVLLILIILPEMTTFANPKIYLIRHAAVDLKKPGWGTSKNSAEYKEAYNLSGNGNIQSGRGACKKLKITQI